jgi:VWFA-related protein
MATSALLFAAVTAGSLLLAQSDSETPGRLVRLNVVATDAKGEPVTNLQASDIRVREDGKLRPIAFFRYAGHRRDTAPPPPGETINRPPVTPTLILFDRWNERLMTAATAWGDIGGALERLESVDSVYIYFLTNHGDLYPVHPLPSTDADLRGASGPTPAQLRKELDDAVQKLSGFRDINAYDPIMRADTTFRALGVLGVQMGSIAGRKNFIWVTHGIPLTVLDWTDFTPQIRDLSVAAAQLQIVFYAVDESARGAGADVGGLSRRTLQMFASLTGGRWYASGNADEALNGAMADSRGSYRVAYYSPFREMDKKEHKIRLEAVPKGVRLLTREGFFGAEMEPDPNQMEQLAFNHERRSPFDAGEIGLRIMFTPDESAGIAHLSIHVNANDVLLEKRADGYHGSVGMMIALYQNGFLKQATQASTHQVNLTQGKYNAALRDGITFEETTPLQAGTEKIRVMVFDPALQALGSAMVAVK